MGIVEKIENLRCIDCKTNTQWALVLYGNTMTEIVKCKACKAELETTIKIPKSEAEKQILLEWMKN